MKTKARKKGIDTFVAKIKEITKQAPLNPSRAGLPVM